SFRADGITYPAYNGPMAAQTAPSPAPSARSHWTGAGIVTGLTFALALVVALAVRGNAVVGIAVLFLVFVPLEKLFALRPQRVFRAGFVTDLTHLLVNNLLVTAATVVLVIVAALPLIWIRSFDLQSELPGGVAIAVALVAVLVGNYWGHRLTHQVPF